MCGRYALSYSELLELEEFLNTVDREGVPEPLKPQAQDYGNYNVAPTHKMPVVYIDDDGNRVLELMHWGYMGWKPKPGTRPFTPINTRDDSILKKPMWSGALEGRRCIVPMNGFIEFTGKKGDKTPHYIYYNPELENKPPLLTAAGVFSKISPNDGQKSFSIITTSPNSFMENLHDRMPAFLYPDEFDDWLNSDHQPDYLMQLLRPLPDDVLSEHIADKNLNNVRNNHPGLLERASLF